MSVGIILAKSASDAHDPPVDVQPLRVIIAEDSVSFARGSRA